MSEENYSDNFGWLDTFTFGNLQVESDEEGSAPQEQEEKLTSSTNNKSKRAKRKRPLKKIDVPVAKKRKAPAAPKIESIEDLSVRYTLSRKLREDGNEKVILVLACNPSSATQIVNDTTTSWLTTQLKNRDWGKMIICNMLPYRTSRPALLPELYKLDLKVHPRGNTYFEENRKIVETTLQQAHTCIAAFGRPAAHGPEILSIILPFLRKILTIAKLRQIPIGCFARNPDGSPRHPTYQARCTNTTDKPGTQYPLMEFPLESYLEKIAGDKVVFDIEQKLLPAKPSSTKVLDWSDL